MGRNSETTGYHSVSILSPLRAEMWMKRNKTGKTTTYTTNTLIPHTVFLYVGGFFFCL